MVRLADKRRELGVELPPRLVDAELRGGVLLAVDCDHGADEASVYSAVGHAR